MMQMDNLELQVIQEEDLNSLEHYGVKGQKWGQRNYQNPDGTYTEIGKERRRVAFKREEAKKKEEEAKSQNKSESKETTDTGKAYKDMTRKELRAAKKRARHNEAERREKREFNREKRRALEEGDIAFISKNISKFSNEEIDDAMTRYKKMQEMKNLNKANSKDADHYINKALDYLEKASKASKSISDIANNFNNMSKTAAEKKKAWISYEYTKDPSLKPLTESEKLSNESARKENDKKTELLLQERERTKQAVIETTTKRSAQEFELKKLKEEAEKTKIDNDMLKEQTREQKYKADQLAVERDKKKFELETQKKLLKDAEEQEERTRKELKRAIREGLKSEEEDLKKALREKEEERKAAERAEKEARAAEKEATNKANQELKDYFKRLKEEEANERKQKELEKKQREAEREAERLDREEKAMRMRVENDPDYKARKKAEAEEVMKNNWWDLMYSGQNKKQKLGSFFSKKDKDQANKEAGKDFDKDDKSINIITRKYMNQLKNSPKDYFKENNVRSEQWKKDLKKHDADVIDKWVKDMKKKYMKERNMDSKTAELKAEEYVESWLDAYDDGLV